MDDGMIPIAAVKLESATGYGQSIRAGAHQLAADEPASNGGTDTGPAPYALLLSALGACTAITLRMYADRKGWALGTVQVALQMLKSRDGRERIDRTIHIGAPLTDEQKTRLGEIAAKTPVTKTLMSGLPIATTLTVVSG